VEMIEAPAERIPAIGDYDVAVAGAGPAGVAAGVAAAREGARALIVDPLAFPGGTATGSLLWGFMGRPNGRILDETLGRLSKAGGVEGYLPRATRLMSTCSCTGEAAGVAAAMAASEGVAPEGLDGERVRRRMNELGNDV